MHRVPAMMALRRSWILLACALAACGDNDDSRGNVAADIATDEGAAMGEDLATEAEVELRGDPPALTIGQIGEILLTLDEGEILQAEVELARGLDEEARDFAGRMIDEHSLHADRVTDILFVRRIEPVDNAVAASLRAEAAATLDELERTPVEEIDIVYMRIQVTMHVAGLRLIAQLIDLAPADAELRTFLQETYDVIAEHRDHAEGILRSF